MNDTKRVTPADIAAAIASEHYFTAGNGVNGTAGPVAYPRALNLLTFCVLVTRNGHTVTGESHCQDPAQFDAQVGRDEARKAAIDKLWPMAVYAARVAPETPPATATPKAYRWGDVEGHEVQDNTCKGALSYKIRMKDGARFRGDVKPAGSYNTWRELAIEDINRQAAAT